MFDIQKSDIRGEEKNRLEIATIERNGSNNIYKCAKLDDDAKQR